MIPLRTFLLNVHLRVTAHAKSQVYPYQAFALFAVCTFPFYYWLNLYLGGRFHDNFLLRSLVVIFCFPLFFVSKWPRKIKAYLAYYWYFTITFSLPFFFTYLVLLNHFSIFAFATTITIVFLFILVLDWLPLIISLCIGIPTGILFYIVTGGIINLSQHTPAYLFAYTSALFFGAIFAHKKDLIQAERLYAMKTLGSSIAHEMRTPLLSITSAASGIIKFIPKLIEAYHLAKANDLPVANIKESNLKALVDIGKSIRSETHQANIFINMLLHQINQTSLNEAKVEICNIQTCLDEAIQRFPMSDDDREKVHVIVKDSFLFYGNQTLMVHVLFNLLKNALHYIKASNKPDANIEICAEAGDQYNYIYFTDTGTGIPADYINKIFDKFFSKTINGAGIGLAFCESTIISFGGKILCESVEKEYTKFTIRLPRVKSTPHEPGDESEKIDTFQFKI